MEWEKFIVFYVDLGLNYKDFIKAVVVSRVALHLSVFLFTKTEDSVPLHATEPRRGQYHSVAVGFRSEQGQPGRTMLLKGTFLGDLAKFCVLKLQPTLRDFAKFFSQNSQKKVTF